MTVQQNPSLVTEQLDVQLDKWPIYKEWETYTGEDGEEYSRPVGPPVDWSYELRMSCPTDAPFGDPPMRRVIWMTKTLQSEIRSINTSAKAATFTQYQCDMMCASVRRYCESENITIPEGWPKALMTKVATEFAVCGAFQEAA